MRRMTKEKEWLEGDEPECGGYEEEGHYWENMEDLQARPWRVRIDMPLIVE